MTIDSLDFESLLSFLAGWEPPISDFEKSRSRWSTWEAYDTEYEALRVELLEHEWALNAIERGEIPFAEQRWLAAS